MKVQHIEFGVGPQKPHPLFPTLGQAPLFLADRLDDFIELRFSLSGARTVRITVPSHLLESRQSHFLE
jgi:hypothetical protein